MTDERLPDDLWDKSGPPDAELRELERVLRPHRWSAELPELSAAATDAEERPSAAGTRARVRVLARALVAAVVLLGMGLLVRNAFVASAPSYDVEWRGPTGTLRTASLRAGELVLTDADSRAQLRIGDIGQLELDPGGRLRLASASELWRSDAAHLVHLEQGLLRASIFAAPRVFQVGTPGGLAVDMGCIYTTEVLDDGLTRLSVETGQVSFETPARQVTVPSGASLVARPGLGPGTPAWDDAPADFRELLGRVDLGEALADDLDRLLTSSRARDSLSLAHLLDVAPAAWRDALVTRLAELEPPDEASWPESVRAGESEALVAWKRSMSWSW